MKKNRGFTLLEIMVVIVILGLLAGLVVPNVMGSADQAKVQKVVTDITQLETALKQYKLDVGRYPTTTQGLKSFSRKTNRSSYSKKVPY